MRRPACVLATLLLVGSQATSPADDKKAESPRKPPDGVYAVLRESLTEKDVLPLKEGEALVVHRHRYLKKDDKEPPRYLVVRSAPDVKLDLAGEPKGVKEGGDGVRILLKLREKPAAALERLTRDWLNKQVTIVLGGEVVTMHKVRSVIKGGDVQITSCAPGGAEYLLKRLKAHHRKE
jgi:preprotein translocase subunit SecD